jgi:acyl-ACP thioesterase
VTVPHHNESFTIYAFQGDASGGASVRSLCEYMQEAAGNHAAHLGFSVDTLQREGVAWVLSRIRIAPETPPAVNDRISVETWPVTIEGLQYRRDFIVRGENGRLIARAVSYWVVVTLATRKVGRVPAFIADAASANAGVALEGDFAIGRHRPPPVEEGGEVCRFRARMADIDRNHHVNNIRYLDWVLESVPADVRTTKRLAEIDLVFKSESVEGDMVVARTAANPEASGGAGFFHALVRERDGREIVRGATLWV